MVKSISKKLYILVAVLLICMLFISKLPISNTAFAQTKTFKNTNVLDDLQGSTINGKVFNISDYPFNEEGEPEIISFLEYCYSYKSTMRDNYGLYVYLYNPQGLAINTSSGRNKIQLRCGKTGNYTKYNLQFLNYSTKEGYEGLFYKFQVELSKTQKNTIFKVVEQNKRVYEVSGYEISVGSWLIEKTVATTYTYSGYALGYGPQSAKVSTLSCSVDGLKDVLHLDVTPTIYRPNGTNGKNKYTQDSLHSVYFAVPNDMIKKYGEMTAVHATWLNAVLKPSLVTGNKSAYNAIKEYLGVNIGDWTKDLEYSYYGAFESHTTTAPNVSITNYYSGYSYNGTLGENFHSHYGDKVGDKIQTLYMMFYAGEGVDSADTFTVSSDVIFEQMVDSKVKYGGDLVNDKYSSLIFEHVDSEFTDVNIERDTEYSLTDEIITQSWWQKLWGNETVTTNKFDGIKAIYAIDKEKDLKGTDGEIAERLFIDKNDCGVLKAYCNSIENADKTVYLFRYQVSDYIAQEATLYQYDPNDTFWENVLGIIQHSKGNFAQIDTNAYFFQETVNLDFDIIDVTFTKNGMKTVVPVVMTPIDIIPDATNPVYTNSDKDYLWILKAIFAILAIVLLFVICMPILPYIIEFLAMIVPYIIKWVTKMVKSIISLFKKKE